MSIETGERYFSDDDIRDLCVDVKDVFSQYPEELVETELIPSFIQYLFDEKITQENAVFIAGELKDGDVRPFEDTVNQVYSHKLDCGGESSLKCTLDDEHFDKIRAKVNPKGFANVEIFRITDGKAYRAEYDKNRVFYVMEYKGQQLPKEPVLECTPSEIIVYDPVIIDQPRSFKTKWKTNLSHKPINIDGEIGGASIKEIENYLQSTGYVSEPKHSFKCITTLINGYIRKGWAKIQRNIDNPGFYYDSDKDEIVAIKKDTTAPTEKELSKAIKVLEELAKHFKGHEALLATVIKWGMISQFAYAKKQIGKWMPYLYLKGAGGSGKTTVALIVLYMYGGPNSQNNIGGSSFDTPYRMGVNLSKSCNPIVVNEPEGVLSKPKMVEQIKVSVESTTSRGKMVGAGYKQIPAFSPVIFTANIYLPEQDAVVRRFYTLNFSYNMRKTEAEKKEFDNTFHIGASKHSPLRHLEHLARFTASEIVPNPHLLADDWQDVMNNIVRNLYADIGRTVPDWLLEWEESESIEDLDNNQIEEIRAFFNNAFNQAKGKITFRDANGFITSCDVDSDCSSAEDFSDINWNIINNRLLDWVEPKVGRDNIKYICFNQNLRKAISERLGYSIDLKSIAEMLGWEYTSVKIKGAGVRKMIKVEFQNFINFLYPTWALDDNKEEVNG